MTGTSPEVATVKLPSTLGLSQRSFRARSPCNENRAEAWYSALDPSGPRELCLQPKGTTKALFTAPKKSGRFRLDKRSSWRWHLASLTLQLLWGSRTTSPSLSCANQSSSCVWCFCFVHFLSGFLRAALRGVWLHAFIIHVQYTCEYSHSNIFRSAFRGSSIVCSQTNFMHGVLAPI